MGQVQAAGVNAATYHFCVEGVQNFGPAAAAVKRQLHISARCGDPTLPPSHRHAARLAIQFAAEPTPVEYELCNAIIHLCQRLKGQRHVERWLCWLGDDPKSGADLATGKTHQWLAHCAEGLVEAVEGCFVLSYVLQQAVGAMHLPEQMVGRSKLPEGDLEAPDDRGL